MQARARVATGAGVVAFAELLDLAETSQSGQGRHIARFLAGLFNGTAFPLDLYDLRLVDIALSDRMLACLDAHRWAEADLHTLVPQRVLAVLERWSIDWPETE
jgi:hypothetical protein